jgi:hypothetical protein
LGSHRLLPLQVVLALVSSAAVEISWQVPLVLPPVVKPGLHASQVPVQADWQQTPSMQKFDAHSLAPPQAAPSAFLAAAMQSPVR